MKKFALILLVLIIFLSACQKVSETKSEKKVTNQLSDMQVTACNTADEAKTCDTRLAELGIVLKGDCCRVLGKCC